MVDEGFVKLEMDSSNNDFSSDVFASCKTGQISSLEAVLQSNDTIDINIITNSTGDIPVHVAASNGHTEIIKLLHDKGASLVSTGQNGDTALHCAVRNRHRSTMVYLKEQGADLNKQNEAGDTAVHIATRQGFVELVEYLRLSGADVNIKNARGSTALHVACQKRQEPIALMLLHLGCRMDIVDQMDEMAIHDACRESLLTVVQTMCSYGCPVDMENKAGFSPLHLAAKAGNAEIVRCLLLSGADIDKYNKDGVRAEDISLAQGFNDVADLLGRLSASITEDKRDAYVQQLMPTSNQMRSLKMKIFGSGGVGKTTLIESLKCGYLRSWIRSVYSGYATPVMAKEPSGMKQSRKDILQVPFENYTHGIDVQNVNISGVGDMSVWEFSGYEHYYAYYDYFVGDPNSLHMVVISMSDTADVRKAQIHFWLNFIRARVAPAEPFGYAGSQLWAPHVIFVATHADVSKGCIRNSKGELEMQGEQELVEELERTFHADLICSRRFFVLDARQAMSPEIKKLRIAVAKSKVLICQYLPTSIGFLEKTITELPSWKRMLAGFPVVLWSSFMEYVRTRVNLLATEDHLKEIACQLQIVGEIVYLERDKEEDLVVIDPKWFGTEILGRLLSYEYIATAPETGRLSNHDLQVLFPRLDVLDLVRLLQAVNICVAVKAGEEVEYDFLMLNVVECLPSTDWTTDELSDDIVCGGIRIVSPPELSEQMEYVYPRLVAGLRKSLVGNDTDIVGEWLSKCKLTCNGVSALVSISRDGRAFDVECRGTSLKRHELFALLRWIYDVVMATLQQCCPGIYLEGHPLSPLHLRQRRIDPRVYSTLEVLSAQMDGRSELKLNDKETETLTDIVAFGSNEVFRSLASGIDLHIYNLTIYSRCQLAAMLDPILRSESEKSKFISILGINGKIPTDETPDQMQISDMDKSLVVWAQNPTSTIRSLCQKLKDFGKPEAVNILLSVSPMYVCVAKETPTTSTS